MSLEKYGPPERGSGTWTDEKRKARGEVTADARRVQKKKRDAGGGMNEKKGGRKEKEGNGERKGGEMLAELEK